MDETIDFLNDLARKLLDGASTLDPYTESGESEPISDVAVAKETLQELCKNLGKIEELLKPNGSLLHRLVRMIDGAMLSHSLERLEQYVADHRATLIRFQVPESLIKRYTGALRSEAKAEENALDNPQTLQLEDALEPIRQLKEAVCKIANDAEIASIVAERRILQQVATGCIGAATIVLDITSAASAGPVDPSAWVLLKAIKSIVGGAAKVYEAAKDIGEMSEAIRKQRRIVRLPKSTPIIRTRHKPKE